MKVSFNMGYFYVKKVNIMTTATFINANQRTCHGKHILFIISRVRANCQPHQFDFNVWNILIPRSSDFVSLCVIFWTRKRILHKLCTNKWRPIWEVCMKPGKPHWKTWCLSVFNQRPRNCSPFLSHIRHTFACLVPIGICILEGT